MAVFVALIFQVLFIFFAMAINVALVVHDKINLQNAVDLAAYYAAEKQAEVLNTIAHTNYQIRQAWKLLNFRYYYLGNLGRIYSSSPQGDAPLWDQFNNPPPLCVVYPLWMQAGGDNPCKTTSYNFPNTPIPTFSVPFLPFTMVYQALAGQINSLIGQKCNGYGAYNWWFASTIFVSYALEAQARINLIHALANELSLPIQNAQGSMIDITDPGGGSVYEGVLKTLEKNLTSTNLAGFDPQSFQVFNSMQGQPPASWLPDIDAYFTLYYQNFSGTAGGCSSNEQAIYDYPSGTAQLNQLFSPANVSELMSQVQAFSGAGATYKLYLGAEKNPWYWVYAGVQATTKPRELFLPFFHDSVQFTATAYAMPFGGTVGPWYGSTWTSPSGQSGGGRLFSLRSRNDWPRAGL